MASLGLPIALTLGLGFSQPAFSQATKRCDLLVQSTPGVGAETACLDLVSLLAGGTAIQTANNATRISPNGFKFCKNAFDVKTSADADVVFIFDNSGSMYGNFAYVNPTTNDTLYYHSLDGCTSNTTNGTLTFYKANGIDTAQVLVSNTGCRSYSGDPYEVRGETIKKAIDFMAKTAPTSTVGVTGFADKTMSSLPPVQLINQANIDQVKANVVVSNNNNTHYGPPIILANSWLQNPALTKTQKRAIVFISDGAPSDSYLNDVDATIPIYSIYLGQVATPDTAKLKELSDRTNGTFSRVDPKNVAAIETVMQNIIKALLVSTMPLAIEVTNTSMVPPQISRSKTLDRNTDGSISLALDSIVGLKLGVNALSVKIVMSDTLTKTYPVTVKADGAAATVSTASLTCSDQASLVMLNTAGKEDSVYAGGGSNYQVKLTRSSNDLASVKVNAISKDSTVKQPWGDVEIISLTLGGSSAGTIPYTGTTAVHGSTALPIPNNGMLESDANGKLVLTWVHPRDPREFASYTLPGKKIPTIAPFISIERVNNVAKGENINLPITNPVVIFGGVTMVKVNPDSSSVAHGACISNCTGNAVGFADPGKNPSFVFKTASPFTYDVSIYDHLGNFVNSAKDGVDATKWQTMPKKGDSVTVVMSILPVASNGAAIGTGVYILKGTIKSQATSTKDSQGNEKKVTADSRLILNRFGYLRR
jgi:hypothetical protein